MRDIEFRGKCKNTGEWVYGDLTHDIPGNPMILVTQGVHDGEAIVVDPSTVGQYTSLKDKKGTKIFEGDIVRYNSVSQTVSSGRVIFYNGCFVLDPPDRFFNDAPYDHLDEFACEVIGIIYDNIGTFEEALQH